MTTATTRFVKALVAAFTLAAVHAVSLAAAATAASPADLQHDHIPLSREAQVVTATDNGDIAGFRDFKFDCRQQQNYSYQESPEAKAALEKFLTNITAHPSSSNAQKTERLALLEAAIKAGSWRADYIEITRGIGRTAAGHMTPRPMLPMQTPAQPAAIHPWACCDESTSTTAQRGTSVCLDLPCV